jgi:sterol desaturase/sphingolipid hydroxylase (fatty acid hydroxylase superfamily)
MTFSSPFARDCGRLAVLLGAIALGAVACFVFPAQLTTPMLRAVYPIPAVRALLRVFLGGALLAGTVDVVARRTLLGSGAAGLALAALALALGGADVPVHAVSASSYLGLDWLLVDLLVMAALFAPLERWLSSRTAAGDGEDARTDLLHFAVGHLLVQAIAFLAVAPAEHLLGWAVVPAVSRAVARQPLALRVAEVMIVADTTAYAWHRLSHRVPFLWRIHAVHHSATQMGWLAASRLHVADVVLTRAVVFTPIFLLGFARDAVGTYLAIVSVHAVFIHADVRWRARSRAGRWA